VLIDNENIMTKPSLQDVTQWLNQPEPAAADVNNALFSLLYDDLHRLARSQMRKEDASHTLSATGLTHEAWFRMAKQTRTQWASRAHFLAVSATMMRRILVNHALAKQAGKRDAILVSLTLADEMPQADAATDVVAVHDALLDFEARDPRAAKVVELKFFGGLENEEVAEVLGISLATVKRDWALARSWLHRELSSG
jgi:RNA polymerase sigma factor (TIGR02999 family)